MSLRVAFVDFYRNLYDRHWVYSLNAVLQTRSADTCYIAERNPRKALRRLVAYRPDLVLYSAFSFDISAYVAFDRAAKEQIQFKSLLGGPGPTFDWNCIAGTTLDAICVGEGEQALGEYVDSGLTDAGNLVYNGEKEPRRLLPLADLDTLPVPARDMVYHADYVIRAMNARQFLSGRGCPFDCTYCFNHLFNKTFRGCGPVVRKKSVPVLLEEIERIRSDYPFDVVVFQDDTFIIDKKWLAEFAETFPKRIGLPFTCNIRANLVTEDIVRQLKEAGCAAVNWSIETADDDLRNRLLKRRMSREQILETGALLNRFGIRHRIGNLIGLPGETLDQTWETVALNIEAKPTLGLGNIFVPFPSLELTQYAMEHGHVTPEAVANPPKDYAAKSILNIPAAHAQQLRRILCLFPMFVRFPALFRRAGLRSFLMRLPLPLLRVTYEMAYVWMFASLYKVRTPLAARIPMLARYIRNLFP